jgi:hypothetical protein
MAPGMTDRLVVVYDRLGDPSAGELAALKEALRGTEVIDEMPGSLLVAGPSARIRAAVATLDGWSCAPEGKARSAGQRPERGRAALFHP